MSRPRIDPATREGQIDGLLRQLERVLTHGRKTNIDGGLLAIVSMARRIRDRARRESLLVDWRYSDDVGIGFDRTPVMFLRPEKKVTLEAFLGELRTAAPAHLERRARGA